MTLRALIPAAGLQPRHWVGLGLTLLLVGVNIWGFSYFMSPRPVRVRHALHDVLSPSGYVGQSLGILAFLMFLFLWLYPMRRRIRILSRLGVLSRWLDVHIVVGLAIPIVGATHASWQFNGLIGLGYMAMLTVSLSGIVGRYLYRHIPRSRTGVEMTLVEANSRRQSLVGEVATAAGISAAQIQEFLERELPPASPNTRNYLRTLNNLFLGDLTRWRVARKLRAQLERTSGQSLDRKQLDHIVHLARNEMALAQQLRMLDATQAVFKFWHVAHLPFAITAFVAVLIHIVVAVTLGVTWFW